MTNTKFIERRIAFVLKDNQAEFDQFKKDFKIESLAAQELIRQHYDGFTQREINALLELYESIKD